jgi:LPXTG-site transpeptidase (sortase) family protein
LRLARILPLLLFVAGVAAFVAAAACGGGDEAPVPTPTLTPTAGPPTLTPTPTERILPTKIIHTPTATATPYAGKVLRIKIPRFNVDAPIEELGINARGELDTPKKENVDVGWYSIYDRPGWGGNSVFSAHIYYHSIPAPFVNLAKAKAGDEVVILMENGAEYRYKVLTTARYNRDAFDTGAVIAPKERPAGKEWITLITCGGALDSTGQEYVDRDVVVAERVS